MAGPFILHYLVPEEDVTKPALESGTGPELPQLVQQFTGQGKTFGAGGRYVPACGLPVDRAHARPKVEGDPGYFDGLVHRGTHLTDHGETCKGCIESEIYRKNFRRHPRHQQSFGEAVPELPATGCC